MYWYLYVDIRIMYHLTWIFQVVELGPFAFLICECKQNMHVVCTYVCVYTHIFLLCSLENSVMGKFSTVCVMLGATDHWFVISLLFVSPLQTTEATAIIMMADTVVEEVVAVGKV